ncbi:hypothetical protein IJG27_02930 [Candidatus Saccharibacteria bacterium]|nr:hypothetical protein [Candidatus Saccharibacteria bacterium]MBQ6461125.1 hypothetical protein [Candidatus Saccharibacteria bacterium]
MKTRLKAKLLTLLAILTLGLGWVVIDNINTNSAYAEENTGTASIFVSPMTQKIVLIPGETYSGSISISNNAKATEDLYYKAEIGSYNRRQDGNSKDDYGVVDVTETTNRNLIMKWISLERETGTVTPNNTEVLNFTIKVPKDAPAGAQYASILVYKDLDDSSNDTEGASVTSKYQIASAIIANVAGETIEKGAIKSNDMPTMLTNNRLEATSMVRNDGNIYTDATYTLQVWPMGSDEEICTNEEKAESSTVLPDTERYHVQTCDLPAVGIFKAKQVVKIFSEESVLEKTIFVCPIWLMVVVLVVVLGIILGIIIYVKKRKSAKETD